MIVVHRSMVMGAMLARWILYLYLRPYVLHRAVDRGLAICMPLGCSAPGEHLHDENIGLKSFWMEQLLDRLEVSFLFDFNNLFMGVLSSPYNLTVGRNQSGILVWLTIQFVRLNANIGSSS